MDHFPFGTLVNNQRVNSQMYYAYYIVEIGKMFKPWIDITIPAPRLPWLLLYSE